MTSTERFLITALWIVMFGVSTWLLGTVSINSGRILVLEQRANNHTREMAEQKLELKEHRLATEQNGKH
jgi:hypothetical protein